ASDILQQVQAERINVNTQNEGTRIVNQQSVNNNQNTQLQQIYNEMGIGRNIDIFA
ncbi:unnamed protein product, partial [marine sediment metagenome]